MEINKLESFLEIAGEKGFLTLPIAKQTKTALEKIKRVIDPQEKNQWDISEEGRVEELFKRFMTKFPKELSPESATTYLARVKKALEMSERYQRDPLGFKSNLSPKTQKKITRKEIPSDEKNQKMKPNLGSSPFQGKNLGSTNIDSFETVFPLRSDFMLSLSLPKNLNTNEVQRMAYYLLTLCSDFKPGQPNVWQHQGPEETPSLPKSH